MCPSSPGSKSILRVPTWRSRGPGPGGGPPLPGWGCPVEPPSAQLNSRTVDPNGSLCFVQPFQTTFSRSPDRPGLVYPSKQLSAPPRTKPAPQGGRLKEQSRNTPRRVQSSKKTETDLGERERERGREGGNGSSAGHQWTSSVALGLSGISEHNNVTNNTDTSTQTRITDRQ